MGGNTVDTCVARGDCGQSGVYGTQGTTASTNIPGGRYGGTRWSDASGNLWLFGGFGYDSIGAYSDLNDLWKFNPTLGTYGEWTWMGGSSTVGCDEYCDQSGVYGTLGTAAATNIPGGRENAVSWTDASGNLWLFGGFGSDSTGREDYFNDVWKFDPKLSEYGEWIWVGGSSTMSCTIDYCGQPGVYGTLGTAAATNIPGGRNNAVSWSDLSGNLWLFGGYGYNSTGTLGYLNDLWKFDPKLGTYGEWTWMGGGGSPIYGTLGTAASTNIPGGREEAVSWSDASGNFWLFGGNGLDSTGKGGYLNDLWKFDPQLGTYGEWTWMGGSSTGNQSGVYGTLITTASANIPSGRSEAVSWSDTSGNLWLFGGYGNDSTGTVRSLNDLWEFDPSLGSNGEWTWMGGSSTGNQSGVYGTLGKAASTNIPGGRQNTVSWTDASGNFWLLGGNGFDSTRTPGYLNDLWRYQP